VCVYARIPKEMSILACTVGPCMVGGVDGGGYTLVCDPGEGPGGSLYRKES